MDNHILNFLLGLCVGLGISSFFIFYFWMLYMGERIRVRCYRATSEYDKGMSKAVAMWALDVYERSKDGY